MADPDDIYNDPDTIGNVANDDDTIDGAPDKTPPSKDEDLTDSIYTPERDTTDLDVRGGIPELDEGLEHDEMDREHPEDSDADSDHLSRNESADERDDTFNP